MFHLAFAVGCHCDAISGSRRVGVEGDSRDCECIARVSAARQILHPYLMYVSGTRRG